MLGSFLSFVPYWFSPCSPISPIRRKPGKPACGLVVFFRGAFMHILPMPSRQTRLGLPSRNLSPALPHGTHHSRQPSKPHALPSPPSIPSHASPRPQYTSVSHRRSRHTHGLLRTGIWLAKLCQSPRYQRYQNPTLGCRLVAAIFAGCECKHSRPAHYPRKKRGSPPTVMNPTKPENPNRKPRFRFFQAISLHFRQIVPLLRHADLHSANCLRQFTPCRSRASPYTSIRINASVSKLPAAFIPLSSHGSLPTRIWHQLFIAACAAASLAIGTLNGEHDT